VSGCWNLDVTQHYITLLWRRWPVSRRRSIHAWEDVAGIHDRTQPQYIGWSKKWHTFGIWVFYPTRCIIVAILIYLCIIVIKWRQYYVVFVFWCKQVVFSCKESNSFSVVMYIGVVEKCATYLDHPVKYTARETLPNYSDHPLRRATSTFHVM